MSDAAAPTRDQVSSHKVNLAERKDTNKSRKGKTTPLQAHDHDVKRNAAPINEGPKLTLQKDGKMLLQYSVSRHTEYVKEPSKRSADPKLFGYTVSEWEDLLSVHDPLKHALAAESGERKLLLDDIVKERLMASLQGSGVRADYLNVQGRSDYMTKWEQVAICSLLNMSDLRLKDVDGNDLGRGIYRLGSQFDHIEIAVLPPNDRQSPYTQKVASRFGGRERFYQFLIVYKNVESDEEFLALRNAMFLHVNQNHPADVVFQDDSSVKNVNNKYLRICGNDPNKHGAEHARQTSLLFVPAPSEKGQPPTVFEDFGILRTTFAIQQWLLALKNENQSLESLAHQDISLRFVRPKYEHSVAIPPEGKGKGNGKGKGKGKGKGGRRSFALMEHHEEFDRKQIALLTVRAATQVMQLVASIPDSHEFQLYVGGQYGTTVSHEVFKGCYPITVVVCKTQRTALDAWKAHMVDRRTKIDCFLRILPAPVMLEPLLPASDVQQKWAAPTLLTSSEFDSPSPVKTSAAQTAVGTYLAEMILFMEPCNSKDIPVELVMQFLTAKGCKFPDIRAWALQNRDEFMKTEPDMCDVTLASILSRFLLYNPFGAPFLDLAPIDSDASSAYGLVLTDRPSLQATSPCQLS